MTGETRPPLLAMWLLRAGALLPPAARRADWRALWLNRLENLWILAGRGELLVHAPGETVFLCRDALAEALWMRFDRALLAQWTRSPGFILALAAASFSLTAILSDGFSGTRSVIYTYIDYRLIPRRMQYDPRADLLVAHFIPILFALTMAVAMLGIGRLTLGRYGWKYWLFLAVKLVSVMVLLPLIWIEGNAALRHHVVFSREAGLVFGWLAWTLAFLGAVGIGVLWVFADQRRRCPVCLGRLAMPVTLGSWASIFDPVTTEMLCDEGHGALSLAETENGPGDRWITLDSSWRGL